MFYCILYLNYLNKQTTKPQITQKLNEIENISAPQKDIFKKIIETIVNIATRSVNA